MYTVDKGIGGFPAFIKKAQPLVVKQLPWPQSDLWRITPSAWAGASTGALGMIYGPRLADAISRRILSKQLRIHRGALPEAVKQRAIRNLGRATKVLEFLRGRPGAIGGPLGLGASLATYMLLGGLAGGD